MLNKLDMLVRQSILSYPMLFSTRWDVLEHLYVVIGNGYDWEPSLDGSVMVDVCGSTFDEQKARSAFFEDCDRWERQNREDRARYATCPSLVDLMDQRDRQAVLDRKRYAFTLENLDLLVDERRGMVHRGRLDVEGICRMLSPDYSKCLTVPDDAEPSFKAGAIEVLNDLLPLTSYHLEATGDPRGLRAAMIAQRDRLHPPPPKLFVDALVAEIAAEESA